MARIVIAPDSFKGSISSSNAARAIAQGWLSIRPQDEVLEIPFADGGEGSLDAIEKSRLDSIRVKVGNGYWLYLPEGIAVVELAQVSGITLLETLDPMNAHTYELGIVLAHAAQDSRVTKIFVALGGSASTDGGVGALMALGYRFLDIDGKEIGKGGGELSRIVSIDSSNAIAAPAQGVVALVDVQSPLLGTNGAAATYAPQKGATPEQIVELEKGLSHLLSIVGRADSAGSGAAGGTSFGLRALWGATFESGAEAIARIVSLREAIAGADLVITGEGRLDEQSFVGKGVGYIRELAQKNSVDIAYCVGARKVDFPDGSKGVTLNELVSSDESISHPEIYLKKAGEKLAEQF
jgi:glycerate kinase